MTLRCIEPGCAHPLPVEDQEACAGCKHVLMGGRIVGTYRVESFLGNGGMSRVYRARHVSLSNWEVAIKTFHVEFLPNQDRRAAMFLQEVASLRKVSDERCVRLNGFGTELRTTLWWLAMDLVPGRTIKEILRTEGPLAPARAARIAGEIAEGLGAIHRAGLVHLDLKGDNVMCFDGTRGPDQIRILDFGISQPAGTRDVVAGAPTTMSPEQAGHGSVDGRSDLFSLGSLLHRMLTGKPAFASRVEVLGSEPAAPSSLVPAVPAQLDAIVARLLQKDPALRYQSADEVRRALEAVGEVEVELVNDNLSLLINTRLPAWLTLRELRRELLGGRIDPMLGELGDDRLPCRWLLEDEDPVHFESESTTLAKVQRSASRSPMRLRLLVVLREVIELRGDA